MIKAGQTPLALRQSSAAAFAGVAPQNAEGDAFDTFADKDTKVINYANPENQSETALAQGGLYDFGNDQEVLVKEIRAHSGNGDITVTVGDRGDTAHDVVIGTADAGRRTFSDDLLVLPSQVLKVTTASGVAAGFIDVYIVKADWF